MKKSEIKEGVVYTDGEGNWRRVVAINLWGDRVHYTIEAGTRGGARDKAHGHDGFLCAMSTFCKWAKKVVK